MGQAILVFDDSAVVLAITRRALTAAGFDVTTALTHDQLKAAITSHFDLILIDVELKGLHGDDVASTLRHRRGVKTPIYLFSSIAVGELAELARNAQLDGYISKLDGTDAMVERVVAILKSDR